MDTALKIRLTAAARREVILDAARHEFAQAGYSGTRVRAIADRAGINDAMLYRHFQGKEDLFEAAVAEPIRATVTRIVERPFPTIAAGNGTSVIRERTVGFFEDLILSMREIAPLLGVVLFADPERGARFYREHIEAAFTGIVTLTENTLADWLHADFDGAMFARMVIGVGWFMAVDDHLGSRPPCDPRRLATDITAIMFDGIALPPGNVNVERS